MGLVNLIITDKDRARFEKYVYPDPNSGCFIWAGYESSGGYGQFQVNTDRGQRKRTFIMAHRMAWILSGKDLDSDDFLCHKCDLPCCVNPDHLFVGDYKSNQADMATKWRGTKSKIGMPYGVTRQKGKFRVGISKDGKLHRFGTYGSVDEAAIVALNKKKEIYGLA